LAFGSISTLERRPLILYDQGARQEDLVALRLSLDNQLSYGWRSWGDLSLSLPLILYQEGRRLGGAPLSSFALGDPGLGLRISLMDPLKAGFGLALEAALRLGLGEPESYSAEGGASGRGRMLFELPLNSRRALLLGLGYRLRSGGRLDQEPMGDELLFDLAWRERIDSDWSGSLELKGACSALNPLRHLEQSPLGINGAFSVRLRDQLALLMGAGMGLLPGYGAPSWRAFLGWELRPRQGDYDGDRVFDFEDRCIEIPGLPTRLGCPAPASTSAPSDWDKDGIPNLEDHCPHLPEDLDHFLDDDGCPDPDNDLDLLKDAQDGAPNAPEDWDGDRDEDGIPDLEERSAQPAPRAPQEPMAPLILGDTLHPAQPLQFLGTALDESATEVLDGLARYIQSHPELKTLEIGVHLEAQGSPNRRRTLSLRRAKAVGDALSERGVPAARLRMRGYGADVPVASNRSAADRARNRRVELRVLRPIELSLQTRKMGLPHRPGIIRPPLPIIFRSYKPQLRDDSLPKIKRMARYLKQRPELLKLEIAVHTDGIGDQALRMRLSQQRAQVVRAALIAEGIAPERLSAQGYGGTRPLLPNHSAANRFLNRRVELQILKRAGRGSP